MTLEMLAVLVLVVVAVVLFATERFPIDLIAIFLLVVLLLSGIVTPEEGVAGFSNAATVTVGAMFILSAALFRSGAVNVLGRLLTRVARKGIWLVSIAIMVTIGLISAFINNTAAVAIFIPVVLGVARESNISASKLLMPLSFASMFGGVCTLIGTSTNILVSSIAEQHGLAPFGMFEFTELGLIYFGAGIIFMLLIGIRLIPERRSGGDLITNFGMTEYLTELILLPEAKSVGKRLLDAPLVKDLDIAIIGISRDGQQLRMPSRSTVLKAGDTLRVRCSLEKIKRIQEREGIMLKAELKIGDEGFQSEEATLVEAIVGPNSELEGRTIRQMQFRFRYGAIALAIRHHGRLRREKLADTPLRAGDALLLHVRRERFDELRQRQAFVFVSEVGSPRYRTKKILPSVLIVAGVVVVAALGILPIMTCAITGCGLMVATGCINLTEAYRAVEWKVIFLLAGVLTLGTALEKSGTALFLSQSLLSVFGDHHPVIILSAFLFFTTLLTSVLSNNATAALLAPIAISTAAALDVDPRPFLIAVAFAASSSFLSPVGYQTNTMIYDAGRYTFKDFVRVGTPISLLFWLLGTIFIPLFWPLSH